MKERVIDRSGPPTRSTQIAAQKCRPGFVPGRFRVLDDPDYDRNRRLGQLSVVGPAVMIAGAQWKKRGCRGRKQERPDTIDRPSATKTVD